MQLSCNGKRCTIYLGRIPKREAEESHRQIEAAAEGRIDPEWLSRADKRLRGALDRLGLTAEAAEKLSLSYLCRAFVDSKNRVTDSTRVTYLNVQFNLEAYFGPDCPLIDITPARAAEFRDWLMEHGNRLDPSRPLSPVTVSKRCKQARGFFKFGLQRGWVEENPFSQMSEWVDENPERACFVERDMVARVLAELPAGEWRAVVALARYGGLRCPSEIMSLRWGDLNWDRRVMRINSTKTKRFVHKAVREVPIFPELVPYLEELDDGTEYVIEQNRHQTSQSIQSRLRRACNRAGVTLWPRCMQNLRASRETELIEEFPVHVVVAWLGNSPQIALRHYFRVTEEHLRRATSQPA